MPDFLHRTTKQYLQSIPSHELPESEANYIEQPDLSAVTGQPSKYWTITGDTVTLMNQSERDAVDAAEMEAQRDGQGARLDDVEDVLRAFMLIVIDEFNDQHTARTNAILDAADNATSLSTFKTAMLAISDIPTRTPEQLRTAIRNRLGS